MNGSASGDTRTGIKASKGVIVIGFGRRLTANLIDAVFVFLVTFFVASVVGFAGLLFKVLKANNNLPFYELMVVTGLITSVIYYVGFWVSSGQTIGKFITGIKVSKADGTRLSWGSAILRYIGYLISAVALSIGFLWLAFDKKRQGWHDKMAGTLVVRDVEYGLGTEGVTVEPSDPQRNWIWLVVWIVVALTFPAGLFGGLLVLGPVVRRIVVYMLGIGG